MALCCGGILLGWSVLADRAELWSVGLPIALGGQLALLVGLILQLDRIWHGHRDASTKMERFEGQLRRMERPEAAVSASLGTHGKFHVGTSEPLVVLDELKHQLDRLETRLRSTGS